MPPDWALFIESRERMVIAPTNLGRRKYRKSAKKTDRRILFRPLEEASNFRRIRVSVENWRGTWFNKELSVGERHWILRIRAGLNQVQAAQQLNMARSYYQHLESSKDSPEIFKITDFEWCRIMRRRAGMTQNEVATHLESSRVWVNRMESGIENCDTLLWFWEQ